MPSSLHQVELALRPVEGARALRLRHSFEIAERLEQRDLQAMVAHHPADLGGRTVEGEEIVLEDLDAVEAGRGDGRELLAQVAADRHGGDRGLHGLAPSMPRDQVCDRTHRDRIAARAQPGDDRGRDLRHQRMVVDRLAPVDVGDVQLDDRAGKHLQRVEDRDRGEGEAGRVDDDAGALVDRLVDPVDDLALAVRLVEANGRVAGRLAAHRLDLGERRRAVDLRLALAEPVQVRAVEDVDRFHRLSPISPGSRAAAAARARVPGRR